MASTIANTGRNVIVGAGDYLPRNSAFPKAEFLENGVYFVGLGELSSPDATKVQKARRVIWQWGARTVEWLDAQPNKPTHVFVYGGIAAYAIRLLIWCRRNGVALIFDIVEWYSPDQLIGGALGPINLSSKIAFHHLYARSEGVVCISSFLQKHFALQGCLAIRVPPTLNVSRTSYRVEDLGCSRKIKLVYAGSPGKKDALHEVISGAAMADPTGEWLELSILGPTQKEVSSLFGNCEIPVAVRCCGRVPQDAVLAAVEASDFSVLLREPLRFASAGFPTKFVESLAVGTPVIGNLTSDLGMYLRDGQEGLVCEDHSAKSLYQTLLRMKSMTLEQRLAMRKCARRTAELMFDHRAYSMEIEEFLNRTAISE